MFEGRLSVWTLVPGLVLAVGVALAAPPMAEPGLRESVTLTGTFQDLDRPGAAFVDEEGQTHRVFLGPARFWAERGWALETGEEVILSGLSMSDGETSHLYPSEIVRGETVMAFVDDEGWPVWRRGARAGQGPGRGQGRRGMTAADSSGPGQGRGARWGGGCGQRRARCGGCPRTDAG